MSNASIQILDELLAPVQFPQPSHSLGLAKPRDLIGANRVPPMPPEKMARIQREIITNAVGDWDENDVAFKRHVDGDRDHGMCFVNTKTGDWFNPDTLDNNC